MLSPGWGTRDRHLVSGIAWYTARAAGVVAYALLTGGVLLGVLLAGRARLPRWPVFAVTEVHRFVALLTGVFDVALEILAAVGISNLLRKRLGHGRWRRIHYLTFAVWAAATVHGIGAGTDTSAEWLRLLYVVSVGSVAAALAWRLSPSPARARRAPS